MTDADPRSLRLRTGTPSGRIAGVDVARGIAVIGMFVAHLVPESWPETIADGRSSVLFATLAGVSLGLISGGPTPIRTDRGAVRTSVLLRGLFLIALGLLLWMFDSGIAIILDYYGAFFLILIPLLFLPRAALIAIALALAALATALLPIAPASALDVIGADLVLYLPVEWLYTGYYPGVLWIVYLLVGLIAARSDLTRRATQCALIAGGLFASVIGYGGAALFGTDASAHSDTVWEMLGAGGLAAFLIGGLTMLTSAAPVATPARAITWPIGAVGSMPLTVYTAQILLLAGFQTLWGDDGTDGERLALLAGFIIGAVIFASLWRRFAGRGPLERLVSAVSKLPRRVDRRPAPWNSTRS